jgi:hypothetical protein
LPSIAGLPDGLFSNQTSKFGYILEGLAMEDVAVFYGHAWSILRSFVRFYGHLAQFVVIWYTLSRFGILYQEKSGNPAVD